MATPLLCDHPEFRPPPERTQAIRCYPEVQQPAIHTDDADVADVASEGTVPVADGSEADGAPAASPEGVEEGEGIGSGSGSSGDGGSQCGGEEDGSGECRLPVQEEKS